MTRAFFRGAVLGLALILGACAGFTRPDPPKVTVASIEEVGIGEALELRMRLKLRVANPNDFPIEYDGLYVKLDVQGRTMATGVSDEKGTVPRFGESLVGLDVTVPVVDVARHALRMWRSPEPAAPVHYHLEGKLNSPLFGATRFATEGELQWPKEP